MMFFFAGPASRPLNIPLFARDDPHMRGWGEPVRAERPLSAQRRTTLSESGVRFSLGELGTANFGCAGGSSARRLGSALSFAVPMPSS
jgi:hypothetical protein